MQYVIGIDTGGTYTDAVLLEKGPDGMSYVKRKAKALTTHEKLEEGIGSSICALSLQEEEIQNIERVVLSTTLATNAIVEGKTGRVGAVIIGPAPHGKLATDHVICVDGEMNIKGRVLKNVREKEIQKELPAFLTGIDAIAISGAGSVRNPELELQVKKTVEKESSIPVMCGHEIANVLGYLERTNTVILNAGLLPVIHRFLSAINIALKRYRITAPVFVLRGDGSIAGIDLIKEKPIETVLSGPAASMVGAAHLSQLKNALVSDMGGTTTDTGVILDKRVALSRQGAFVGGWNIKIKSAQLRTFGLGGDSSIEWRTGGIQIGPERVLPACRGGIGTVTPTDILHYKGECSLWSKEQAEDAICKQARFAEMGSAAYAKALEEAVVDRIYEVLQAPLDIPICAVGAPAGAWYAKVKEKYHLPVYIPQHHEVANAVGAAVAGIQEVIEATIRRGEEGHGYLAHTACGRFSCRNREEAMQEAIRISTDYARNMMRTQNLEVSDLCVHCEDIFEKDGELICNGYEIIAVGTNTNEVERRTDRDANFIETKIRVTVQGKIFRI